MSIKTEKATSRDIDRYLNDALRNKYQGCSWLIEYDDDFMFFRKDIYKDNKYFTEDYKVAYTLDGVNVEITGEPIAVKRETSYVEIEEDASITKTVMKCLKDFFNKTTIKDHNFDSTIPVIKQFNEEQMIAVEALYIAPDEVDGHGETADADTLKSMVDSFNRAIDDGRLTSATNHKDITDKYYAINAWINPCECYIGDKFVPEGQPLVKMQFTDKDEWEKRKSGELCGVSIGARCKGIIKKETE